MRIGMKYGFLCIYISWQLIKWLRQELEKQEVELLQGCLENGFNEWRL